MKIDPQLQGKFPDVGDPVPFSGQNGHGNGEEVAIPVVADVRRSTRTETMNTLPLQVREGHVFVELGGELWLVDTGAPTSFGTSGQPFHRCRAVQPRCELSRPHCGHSFPLCRPALCRPSWRRRSRSLRPHLRCRWQQAHCFHRRVLAQRPERPFGRVHGHSRGHRSRW